MRLLIWLSLLGVALLTRGPAAPQTPPQPPPSEPPKAAGKWAELQRTAAPAEDAERLVLPKGPPPNKVAVIRLQAGTGKILRPKDGFVVDYKSFYYRSGKLAEDHWGGSGFSWTYGIGQTVKAWEPGLRRMREGEWRQLLVPSDWAYENGARVYLIQLRKVREH